MQNIVESMHMGYNYLIVFWSKNGWTDLAQVELLLEKELRTMDWLSFTTNSKFESLYPSNLMMQTFDIPRHSYIIWSTRFHSLIYLRSMILGCKNKGFRKIEFVAKTKILSILFKIFLQSFLHIKMQWYINICNYEHAIANMSKEL